MFGLDLGNLLVHLRADTLQFETAMRAAVVRMRNVGRSMTRIGRSMMLRITLPLALIGTAAVKAFASFDDAMTKSLAIMGNVSSGMQQEMREVAIALSREGVTSATDLAKSYFFLASAGLSAEQSVAALATVESFAVAGAFDMAKATDLLTDAQSALGLTVKDATENMMNMKRVSDVLTGANTLANATTEQFSSALTTQAGPAMKAFNVDLEEGVAVLAAYADQGIKAQLAGTMFGRMLRLMTKGFRENEKAWRAFNISIFDSQGELLPMADIVRELSRALGNLSTQQKGAALDMLGFQARSQQTILPLLGLGQRIETYTKQLREMAGITEEVQAKQLTSFTSQMKILKNNIVAAGMAIGSVLAPQILRLNQKLLKGIDNFLKLDQKTQLWIIGIGVLTAAIPPLVTALGFFAIGLAAVLSLLTAINIPLLLLVGGVVILRAVWLQNVDAIKEAVSSWFEDMKRQYEEHVGIVKSVIKRIADDGWLNAFIKIRQRATELVKHLGGIFRFQQSFFAGGTIEENLAAYLEGFEQVENGMKRVADKTEKNIENNINKLKAMHEQSVAELKAIFSVIKTEFAGVVDDVVNQTKEDVEGLIGTFDKLKDKILEALTPPLTFEEFWKNFGLGDTKPALTFDDFWEAFGLGDVTDRNASGISPLGQAANRTNPGFQITRPALVASSRGGGNDPVLQVNKELLQEAKTQTAEAKEQTTVLRHIADSEVIS